MKHLSLSIFVFFIISCSSHEKQKAELQEVRIAFLADVHLQDVYGKLFDTDFEGVNNPVNGRKALIRTMESQLHSTRIFNENYFAFLAALDDIVKKGIKHVVLPGDFSDDGQPVHIRGLKQILESYQEKYGLNFLAITGNHDPVRPFSHDAGKRDFLGLDGKKQPIMSSDGMYVYDPVYEHPTVISPDIRRMGYQEILNQLRTFGFLPQKKYHYWETPFSRYSYDSYTLEKAKVAADLKLRTYKIEPSNYDFPDVSYLVEPIEDVWLLALDGNVYLPKSDASGLLNDPKKFNGASIGYNQVIAHKKHLINWVKKVSSEAERLNKTLIAFSHYPMVDFNDDASEHIKNLMGTTKMQLHRVPEEDVARIFADAGIKLHMGGHMHINDTGIRTSENGHTLVNVQIPSLAAYIPAYKILTIKDDNWIEIETKVIDSVPRFNEFFKLYEQEYTYLSRNNKASIWNRDILDSKNYYEFTNWHLKELIRLRFIPEDWPEEIINFLYMVTGKELLVMSLMDKIVPMEEFMKNRKATIQNQDFQTSWASAQIRANELLLSSKYTLNDFDTWTGEQIIEDFYRFRNADELAYSDIGLEQMKQYEILAQSFINQSNKKLNTDEKIYALFEFMHILHKFANGLPSDHFMIDLQTGKLHKALNEH